MGSTMSATRQALIEAEQGARDQEAELYPLVTDEPPSSDGSYRVKDHIAHLTAWRRRAVEVLRRTGGKRASIDKWNAEVYERTKDQPAEQVIREARDSWAELLSTIEGMTEEQLHEKHPFNPELEVWVVVYANGDHHFEEHAGYIAELRSA
jgi:DinB family protein